MKLQPVFIEVHYEGGADYQQLHGTMRALIRRAEILQLRLKLIVADGDHSTYTYIEPQMADAQVVERACAICIDLAWPYPATGY